MSDNITQQISLLLQLLKKNDNQDDSSEADLEKAYAALEARKDRIEGEAKELEQKMTFYTQWAWGLVVIGLVLGLVGLTMLFYGKDGHQFNEYGDYTGGVVASAWSLAGLFMIYVAFLGQKIQMLYQQLELQQSRWELKATRHEIKGQREEMKKQTEAMDKQNATQDLLQFENTFFQMVRLHHEIVGAMEYMVTSDKTEKGRACFKFLHFILKNIWSDKANEQTNKDYNAGKFKFTEDDRIYLGGTDSSLKEKSPTWKGWKAEIIKNWVLDINEALQMYCDFQKQHGASFEHYFVNLYHIIKLIADSNIQDKQKYASLVRAQLSTHETVLLFYNILWMENEHDDDRFKCYANEFHLFENLNKTLLLHTNHITQYEHLQ